MFRLREQAERIPHLHISLWANTSLEITAEGADKGFGMKTLCGKLGIRDDESMVIGDGENDEPMFTPGRFKVAMGNASEKLKSIADYVTLDSSHEGVAAALNHLILSQS